MIDQLLKVHLAPIDRDYRRWQLFRTLAQGWLAAAGAGLIFVVIRLLTGWASPWVFVLLCGGTLAWTAWIWRRNRRPGLDCRALARTIEAENPGLHAVLLTAVEQQPDPATGELNFLQERVIREALARDCGSEWQARISQRLAFASVGSAAALLLLAGTLLSLYRFAPPGSALFHLAEGVTVTPGDTSLEKGASLVVLAQFAGRVPAEAFLVVRPANEPERRLPLARNLQDPVFGTSLPDVKADLTYRVEYRGERTRDFKVTLFEHPRLERADANLTFPEYTGLPPKTIEDTRRVSAVEGSTLDWTFHLNKPVRSATLAANSGERISLHAQTNSPNAYASSFKLERSGRYDLLLVDDAGRTNKLPSRFVFEALTNRAPELKFVFPRGDQRVSALEEIAFQGEAADDFGLKAYGIAYNLAGQETRSVELGQAAPAHEKRAFAHLVALENLGAQPDQLLSYYLWADDIGPDGHVRRTAGDMFFAEIRPFDEIFREGQSLDATAQQQQQQQQQNQNSAERIAELQKQIITATWNLQRREAGAKPSAKYAEDAGVVKESQESAREQVRRRRAELDDPRSAALLDSAEKEMEKAADQLAAAAGGNSVKPLPPALAAEQSAYQALLRLAEREYQIVQGRQNSGGQTARGARAQRQLDQLELRQSQNRYETERQAAPPQNPQQREQLQAFNRLKELAQRQQDVNERLRELQAALPEARTAAEREEIQRQLKRLQEEQQQLLADVDELRQRMDRPENQTQMAEARQQLEQTRSEVQRTAEEMQRGEVSQALASGTRAQRDLQELRDDFRRQSASQFTEDMRELRNDAREIAQQQESIGRALDALSDPDRRQTLTDAGERQALASQFDEQKKRLDELVKHATDVSQKAEPAEPLLSRQLYDTLRQAVQDDAKNLQDTTDDLLNEGRMPRPVYERLRGGSQGSQKAVAVAADLLRDGFPAEAGNLEQRARRSINDLKAGVERAAQSVLGDDTEALRLARGELDELSRQLEQEIAQGRRQTNTNGPGGAQSSNERDGQQAASGSSETPSEPSNAETSEAADPAAQAANRPSDRGGEGRPQTGTASANQPGNGGGEGRQAQPGQGRPGERAGNRPNGRADGGGILDQLGEAGGGAWGGPLTGPGYTQWSDRLRDVEEMLDVSELRTEAARIRDRARNFRLELKRHAREPQWDLARMEIAGPLVELRSRVAEELARRESKEAPVPVDRDPVPTRYSELVRRYYEQLGTSEPAGGVKQ